MKKITLTILSVFVCYFVMAGQGGPDKYGYTWKDNLEPGGPTFHWVDIVNSEYRVFGLADDNFKGPYTITTSPGPVFDYYWYPVDQLWIGSNGYVSFSPINLASVFPSIPDSIDNKHNYISALLTDLTFTGAGNPGKCYLKVTADSVIISFITVPFYAQVSPYWTGSNTFQIILDKTDKSITVNYLAQNGTAMTSTDVKGGIENVTGTIGLMPFIATYPSASYTIKYYYPVNSTYFVTDGAVRYNSIPFNRGIFVPKNANFSLISQISNMGNLPIPPVFTAAAKVKTSSNTVLLNSSVPFNNTLAVQDDSLITFPTIFNPTTIGTYSYITRLSGVVGDAVVNNDSAIQEIVVVDTTQVSYDLGYCYDVPDVTGISWVDGHGGVGVYFKPLNYPVKINNVQFYILSNLSGVGCSIKLYDDNGPNGGPGTLLDSTAVVAPTSGWITLSYNFPVVIYSGGFYVGWEMGGTNITMAVDKVLPISHRTFEIIGNSWSEYRDGLTQDFMIRCNVEKTLPQDLGSVSITHPLNNAVITSPTQVSFWIKNYGSSPMLTFPVYYKFANQPTVTQNYVSPFLMPGDSILFTFNTLLSNLPNTSGKLCAWTGLTYDANHGNDTTCIFVTTQTQSGLDPLNPESSLTIYPNPFSTYCTLDFGSLKNEDIELQINDLTGRMMRSQTIKSSTNFRLERGNLKPGIYMLRIKTKKQEVVKRLVID